MYYKYIYSHIIFYFKYKMNNNNIYNIKNGRSNGW